MKVENANKGRRPPMKSQNIQSITIAALLLAGFSLSGALTPLSAAQRPRPVPSYSRPVPPPAPRQAPPPRPAPASRQAPPPSRQPQPQVKQEQQTERRQQEQKAREREQQQKLQEKQEKEQQKQQARQQKEMEKLRVKQEKEVSSSVRSNAQEAPKANSPAASNSITSSSVTSRDNSRSAFDHLNAKRAGMTGINGKPLPTGDVTVHTNGNLTVKASGGRQYGVRANGTIASVTSNGKSASFNSKGKLTSVNSNNMSVRRAAHGERIVVSHPAANTTVVVTGRHNGYIERTFQRENQTYVQRTVVINSRIVTHTYVVYGYHGVLLPHLVSPVFYPRAFYGWVFYPWVAPVGYTWVWLREPWYVGPNPYFVAYPSYPSASLWLTDYYLGQTLSASYQEQQDELADLSADYNNATDADDFNSLQASVTTPITPEMKTTIAAEVREQIAAESTAAAHPEKATSYAELPSILSKGSYLFVVAENLSVTTDDQMECALQAGDTLQLTASPSDDSPLAEVRVTSSRKMDCPAGVKVLVSLQDLQEMQNNFRSQVSAGLGTLQNLQGKDGLPSAPPEALSIPPRPATAGIETMQSSEAVSMLDAERQQADALELEMNESLLKDLGG